MARPRKPAKSVLAAPVRSWFTKAERDALGRYARVNGKSISTLVRAVMLAAMAADLPQKAA